MEGQLPSPEPPKDPAASEVPPTPVVSQPLSEVVGAQGNTSFTSGMAGGEGNGTAATKKSESIVNAEVDTYMGLVREALSLSESDPAREAKMLEFMGKIEEAKANGEMEASVIGEGRDRAVILQRPAEVVVVEPACLGFDTSGGKPQRLERFGDMQTRSERYIVANRGGFTGLAVTMDQSVQIDPNAEMFSVEGSNFSGGQYGVDRFQRQFGKWLKDCEGYVKRGASNARERVNSLMAMKDYQQSPNIRQYPEKWMTDGKPQGRPGYEEAQHAWVDSDTIRADGMWAGFIQVTDGFMDTPVTRTPGNNRPWFDVRQTPVPFRVEKPETVEAVLKANIIEPKPKQPVVSQPPQPGA